MITSGRGITGVVLEDGWASIRSWAISISRRGPITLNQTIDIVVTVSGVPLPIAVTVSEVTSSGFTFKTVRDRHFFDGTISFTAEGGNGGVRFTIRALGNHAWRSSELLAFPLFGEEFEDKQWRNFLKNVGEECKGQK